jgi:endonuclease YncB( thermonuclease family)
LRCRHIPYLQHPIKKFPSFTFIKNLSCETLYVRITGIDAPEKENSLQEAQPFAKEATDFVIQHVLDKEVKMTFLKRDQYGRALVTLWLPRRFKCLPPHDLGQLLLSNGLAVIYVGKDAEYNGRFDIYKKEVEKAKKKKKGIWGLSKDFQTPAEYKRKKKGKQLKHKH